jgi:nucleoside-diphosphate-sugar epimerase
MKLLITGTASGLGRHLIETLGGAPWNRQLRSSPERHPDVIIHSAWPARPPTTAEGLGAYVEDTLELARRLTEWPHRKFIFLSSSEVYPLAGHSGGEDEPIAVEAIRNLYGACKLMAESIIRTHGRNVLILRSTGLLGPTARPSSLIRLLREESLQLTLAPASSFYYLLHQDASAFLRLAIAQDLIGIYNLSSSGSVTLGEVAERYGKRVRWGDYVYQAGPIRNRKIADVFPAFRKTSWEVIEEYRSLVHDRAMSQPAETGRVE